MKDMKPLFDTILDYIPAPEGDPEAPTQVLISTIDYNEYVGRIGVVIKIMLWYDVMMSRDMVVCQPSDGQTAEKLKSSVSSTNSMALKKVEVKEATIGSIVAISSIPFFHRIHSALLKIR